MIKKNIIKKKACATTRESNVSIKPGSNLGKPSISGYKPSRKPEKGGKCVDYNEGLLVQLQDPELVFGYLNEAILDEDQRVFLIALKDVLMAQKGGMTEVAKGTGLNRQNLYRMLSAAGNPSWKNLKAIFDLLGLQVRLEYKK
jgi:probable addiction module antidote protein